MRGEIREGQENPWPSEGAGRDEDTNTANDLPDDPSYKDVLAYVARSLNIDPVRLAQGQRIQEDCAARHMIALILKDRSRWSLAQIARAMNVTFNTARHRVRAGGDLIATDATYRRLYKRLVGDR